MHKITKGLKKKKKGKKSKHKEDDLFKPEELEAYRREHQQQSSEGSTQPVENEEWKKFLALTSDVDDILKKTQSDLDRIKSTSFFKRVPPPSEQQKQQQQQQETEQKKTESVEQVQETVEPTNLGIVKVSESESEEDEDEDVFDTAYIDAIAAGEVKLAYIPESPTEETTSDDPFDTSIAERAILGPAVERKGKKLVPIGAAVEVLTGRVQLPTCATQRPVSSRRKILKERDLLLGSFDDNANAIVDTTASTEQVPKTLLDEDTPLPDEPIDLAKPLNQVATPITQPTDLKLETNDIISEFDVINKIQDEDDEEFAALAAESLAKTPTAIPVVPAEAAVPLPTTTVINGENWAAFDNDNKHDQENFEETESDPFDTAFADNLLPGKAELKIIENEILNEDIDFDPRSEDKLSQVIISKVSINITDPIGQRESISPSDRVPESELNLIKPIHRDLLGGSNTDLSNLNDQPLKPSEQIDENYIEYCDPFDTSIVETAKLPGQTELKFIEKELLGDLQINDCSIRDDDNDDDFDPRGEEIPKERTLSRPDVLNIAPIKAVSFDLPSPIGDLLAPSDEQSSKKPLTPFYIRKHSIVEQIDDNNTDTDPFDTSFVSDIAPGKAELKYIEKELFDPNLCIADQNFDPRDENQAKIDKVVESIKQIANKPSDLSIETNQIDLLSIGELEIIDKVLTPAAEIHQNFDDISYKDPFDTSIATNILPGKTELKLIESELIHSNNLIDPDFDPPNERKVDLLDSSGDIVICNPLNPVKDNTNSFDSGDIDPFDTSIANNIVPGKAELKLLESELV